MTIQRSTTTHIAPLALLAIALVTPMGVATAGSATDVDLPTPIVDADFYDLGPTADTKVELGRLLFFDKVLSGNRNISCATCHHPTLASGDGVALGFGEGASGLGPDRRSGETFETAVHGRVPRNAQALFNVGAKEFTRMYYDGRVETDPEGYYEGGFITPAKWKLPTGLENVLAAQAMFPVQSPIEMAGQKGENPVADAKSLNRAAGPKGVWELLAARLRAIPEYVAMFRQAFPEEVATADDVTFPLAANAIAAFETRAFRADDSPFDLYLRGKAALGGDAERGMELFYGKARCATCHSGKFQTDHEFHAIAMPQLGPGKEDGQDGSYWRATGVHAFVEDFGRGRVTVRVEDRYKFRTPSLRNVAATGPWGHSGAYDSLESVVRHHIDPNAALGKYVRPDGLLPAIDRALEVTATGSRLSYSWLNDNRLAALQTRDGWVLQDTELRRQIADANELAPIPLTDGEVGQLVAFLRTLTDPSSIDLEHEIPDHVPSGLPVED